MVRCQVVWTSCKRVRSIVLYILYEKSAFYRSPAHGFYCGYMPLAVVAWAVIFIPRWSTRQHSCASKVLPRRFSAPPDLGSPQTGGLLRKRLSWSAITATGIICNFMQWCFYLLTRCWTSILFFHAKTGSFPGVI